MLRPRLWSHRSQVDGRGKKCSRCGVVKPVSAFSPDLRGSGGLASRCKPCGVAVTSDWQKRNPDAKKRLAKANYVRNRERYRKERADDYAANAVARRASMKARYESDPAFRSMKMASAAARYKAKSDDVKAYQKLYRSENADKVRALGNNARARQMAAEGKTTAAEWRECLEHFDHRCAYCLRHESEVGKLARDHMRPLTRGGSNWPENLVPACKSCNSSKNAKTPLEFARTSCGLAA